MGHPALRKISKEYTLEEIHSRETNLLINEMYQTMKWHHGLGLAAPQIGINKQLCLIEIEKENIRYQVDSDQVENNLFIIFNPKITVLDDRLQSYWEGCLSVPGLRGEVSRPQKIKIEYLDQNGEERHIITEGFLSTVFQHEIDHLFGRLYIDHIKDMTKFSFEEEWQMYQNTKA